MLTRTVRSCGASTSSKSQISRAAADRVRRAANVNEGCGHGKQIEKAGTLRLIPAAHRIFAKPKIECGGLYHGAR
jgi:hypothetical protein